MSSQVLKVYTTRHLLEKGCTILTELQYCSCLCIWKDTFVQAAVAIIGIWCVTKRKKKLFCRKLLDYYWSQSKFEVYLQSSFHEQIWLEWLQHSKWLLWFYWSSHASKTTRTRNCTQHFNTDSNGDSLHNWNVHNDVW